MPDITDPEAVRFCNERIRVYADAMVSAYETTKALISEWNANSLAAKLPDTADVVIDGAAIDGRHQCTGAKVNAVIANANAVITWFEGGGPPSRIDRFRSIAVHGESRF